MLCCNKGNMLCSGCALGESSYCNCGLYTVSLPSPLSSRNPFGIIIHPKLLPVNILVILHAVVRNDTQGENSHEHSLPWSEARVFEVPSQKPAFLSGHGRKHRLNIVPSSVSQGAGFCYCLHWCSLHTCSSLGGLAS